MVKVHKLVAAIATTFTLSTTGAYALNMGEISWKSAYGQPLNATIELSNTAGLTAKDIQASLASNAEFSKAGILHSNELAKLTFTTIMGKEGKAYIKVTSNSPIKEPYLDLLVNVSFQGTKISKDYTILLDLPSTNNNTKIANRSTNEAKKAPITTETTDKVAGSYIIQKGDTLWTIAEKERGTNNTAKTAAAIYKKNPNAFINGSINHLIAGYTIKLPSAQEIQAIPLAEANALFISPKETKQSNSHTTKQPVQTIVDKKQADQLQNRLKSSEQALNNARLENDELSTKLEQLQNEIDKLKEVSDIKDEQINTIKSQLTDNQPLSESTSTQTDSTSNTNPATTVESNASTENTASTSTATTAEPTANDENSASTSTATTTEPTANDENSASTTTATTAEPNASDENSATTTTTATTEPNASAENSASTTTAATTEPNASAENTASTTTAATTEPNANAGTTPSTPALPKTEEDDSLFLGLDSSLLIKLGCGVLLIVCIAAIILRRKKAANETEVDLSHVLLDDSDSHEILANQPDHLADATTSSDSPKSSLEDGTNITEKVDIYLAYERYDEAISLLSEALKNNPNNDEYRFKLLEIYAEQGDAENFEKAAQELLLHSPLAQQKVDKLRADHPALQKANINSPAPKEPIEPTISSNFKSATNTAAHDDQFPVIEDTPILAKPVANSSEAPHTSINEQPLAKDSTDTTSTVFNFQTSPDIDDAVSKANADFSLETIHTEPTIEKAPLFSTDGTDIDGFNTDSPVYEFAAGDTDLKKDEPEEENYKFDLGIEEHKASNNLSSEAKPLDDVGNSNDIFAHFSSTTDREDNSIDQADEVLEKDQVTTKLELVHAYLEMNDTEGAQDLLNEIIQEGNEAQKAEAKQLLAGIHANANQEQVHNPSSAGQTFETTASEQSLGDLQSTSDKGATSEATTLPKEATETPKIAEYAATTDLNSEANSADVKDLDLGFELSTQDEVSTKLELAHAYIDMGDITGAKEILDEVLKEGNSEQQKQAERLISSLN